MDWNKIFKIWDELVNQKNNLKKIKVKPIKEDVKTKEIINKGKIEIYIGKIMLDKSKVDLRKDAFKLAVQKLDKTDDFESVCELQEDLIEGHVHVIATLGFLMAIMNFTSSGYNSTFIEDNGHIVAGKTMVNNGMSLTRVVKKDSKDFYNKSKYEKIDFNKHSKYNVVNNIKKAYKLNTDDDLRNHWINYGEVYDSVNFDSVD